MTEKTLADKMYLHKAHAVAVVNPDAGCAALLDAVGGAGAAAAPTGGAADWVLLFATDRATLVARLPDAVARLQPGGALWIAYRKGGARAGSDLDRDSIGRHAAGLGLDTVAIVAADTDWSCLRLKRV